MGSLIVRSCVLMLGVVGLVACGTANSGEDAENVGTAQQALDNATFSAPPGYPNVGLSYRAVSTLPNPYSPDWNHFGVISPRWFLSYGASGQGAGYYGMNCDINTWPYRDFLRGVSVTTSVYGDAGKCARTTRDTNYFSHVRNDTREVKYLSRVATAGSHVNINDRAGSEVSWTWDGGANTSNRAECRAHYAATAISMIETGEIDAIVCNQVDSGFIVNVSQSMCTTLPFDGVNHCIGNNCSGGNDWAVGSVKNTCGNNQYVKAISKRKVDGKLSALLCCNFN